MTGVQTCALPISTLSRDENPSELNSRGSLPSVVEPTPLPYEFRFGEELPEELGQKLLEGQQVLRSSNSRCPRRHSESHSAQPKRVDLLALLNFYTQQKENMSTKQMPLPDSKDAPKVFDGRSPDLLPRFIDVVEQLFKMHSVMDKQQIKEYLVRYATPTIEDKWRGLETFANEFSFEDFKEEILDSYLETRDWSMGAFQRLQGLCARY